MESVLVIMIVYIGSGSQPLVNNLIVFMKVGVPSRI